MKTLKIKIIGILKDINFKADAKKYGFQWEINQSWRISVVLDLRGLRYFKGEYLLPSQIRKGQRKEKCEYL